LPLFEIKQSKVVKQNNQALGVVWIGLFGKSWKFTTFPFSNGNLCHNLRFGWVFGHEIRSFFSKALEMLIWIPVLTKNGEKDQNCFRIAWWIYGKWVKYDDQIEEDCRSTPRKITCWGYAWYHLSQHRFAFWNKSFYALPDHNACFHWMDFNLFQAMKTESLEKFA
jgi:hypothetical protein